MNDLTQVVDDIADRLNAIPTNWDGQEAYLALQAADFHKNEIEWPGYYFRLLCIRSLGDIMEFPGPRYGRSEFAGYLQIPWETRAPKAQQTRGIRSRDTECMTQAIDEYGCVGSIIALGEATIDADGSFSDWYTEYKGGRSPYQERRSGEDAPPKIMKTSYSLNRIEIIMITEANDIYGQGRNQNDASRRPKHVIGLNLPGHELARKIEFS